jgi:hypothetical protein
MAQRVRRSGLNHFTNSRGGHRKLPTAFVPAQARGPPRSFHRACYLINSARAWIPFYRLLDEGGVPGPAGPYVVGYPLTPFSITKARHALPLYALRAGTNGTALQTFQGWPPARWVPCSHLTTSLPWIPNAVRACRPKEGAMATRWRQQIGAEAEIWTPHQTLRRASGSFKVTLHNVGGNMSCFGGTLVMSFLGLIHT